MSATVQASVTISLQNLLHNAFPDGICGLIFDCDGVLVDSREANISYYNLLLRELGKPPLTKEQADYAQMATAEQSVEQVMTPEELARLPEISARYPYSEMSLPLLRPYPGLVELVNWLFERGVRLGIHTNRGQGIWSVLDNIGLRHAFDPVMTADVVQPKPHPEGVLRTLQHWDVPASQVAFIGDSPTDAGAARAAGVRLIAYENTSLPTDLHVDSFAALQKALDSLCIRSGKTPSGGE